MDVTHILDGLNERQREAVTAPVGNLLVVAGAGSGKTRVLVHRIAWLIEAEGASPHSVLAVTFTNKAAAEMRSRTETLLDAPPRAMWVGTFHGIAHRLLRMHWEDAGLPQNFQIIDADDQQRLVRRVLRSLDLDEQRWPPRQACWFINGEKDEGRRAHEVVTGEDHFLVTQKKIYEAYEEICRQNGVVDFAELLLRCHELWLERPDVLAHYRQRFAHILVDEFQDTNTIQYASLRVLAGDESSVMAVGDDDQSIYGWRGAKIENIHRFSQDFRETSIVRLEQNYRSTGTILKAANGLIDNNTDRLGKELWTASGDGDPILLHDAYNEVEEARFVADRSHEWIDGGGSPDEVAVLYRSNAQSRPLEEAFLRADIPYRIYGGLRFFERAEIKNALAYMRMMNLRHSDVAFERIVNLPARGIGAKTVDAVRALARERGVSLWQATKDGIADGGLRGRAASVLGAFLALIDDMAAEAGTHSLREIAQVCVESSGLMDYHKNEPGERGLARKENLEELVAACRRFETERTFPLDPRGADGGDEDEGSILDDFLDQAALESGEYQAETGAAVQMMTLHSAKGLEFPLVFITGMEEGLFPSRNSDGEPGRMEEERRLAYVGITRAMRQLYLTRAETRWMYGTDSYNPASRFLHELPDGTWQEVRLGGAVKRARFGGSSPKALDEDDGALRIGQRVHHGKFGEGIVVQSEGHGERARVQVNFAEAGAKWLMLGFANLETLD
ncbi:MAG: DNA helicase II [Gammaproteobacteria bacterium]|nr:DNA helicase II [Gammaproteobacteria bacterium]